MGRNLTNLPISASFQYLMQVSGSDNDINDGLGNEIDSLNVSASYATTASFATTASYVAGANVDGAVANATSASYATQALTASFAEFASGSVDVNAVYTASITDATITFEKGDTSTFDVTVDNVTSASFATTASYAENAVTPTLQEVLEAGDEATGSIVLEENTTTDTPASIELKSSIGDLKIESGDSQLFSGPKLTMANMELFNGKLTLDNNSLNNSYIEAGTTLDINTDRSSVRLQTEETTRLLITDDYVSSTVPFTSSNGAALFRGDGDFTVDATGSIILEENTTTNTPASIELKSGLGDVKLESGDSNLFTVGKLTVGGSILSGQKLILRDFNDTYLDGNGTSLDINTDNSTIRFRTEETTRFTVGDNSVDASYVPFTASEALFTGDITGDLVGNADTATSASFATTASFALNAAPIDTGSLMETGSVTDATLTFTKADASTFDLTVDNVASASFATTASFAQNAGASTLQEVLDEGNEATGSIVLNENTTTNTEAFIELKSSVGASGVAKLESLNSSTFVGPRLTMGTGLELRPSNLTLSSDSYFDDSVSNALNINSDRSNGIFLRTSGDIKLTIKDDEVTSLIPFTGSTALFSGDITGDLVGNADTATSASHAVQADNATTADSATTANTASYIAGANVDGEVALATTASFALNAGASTLQEVLDEGNEANADIVLTGSYQRVSGSFSGSVIDNITDTYTGTEKVNHVITLTQAEYDALSPEADTFYVITDADATMITASVSNGDTLTFTKDDGTTFDITVEPDPFPYTGSIGILADSDSSQVFRYDNPAEKLGFRVKGGAMFGGALDASQRDEGFVNFIAGERNVIEGGAQTSFIGGARENTITNGAENAAIIGANNNEIGASRSTIQASTNSTLTDSSVVQNDLFSAIIGGQNHALDGFSGSVILGGDGITATAHNTVHTSNILATGDIELSGSRKLIGSDSNVMIGSTTTTLDSANTQMISIGGVGNSAGNSSNLRYGAIIGGGNNNFGTNNGAMGQSVMLGGNGNTMNSADDAFAIGGGDNSVTAARAGVVGGTGNTASHQRSIVVGGQNLSTSKDDEVVVPSITVNDVIKLEAQNPLPTGGVGQMAVSGSNLYYHNGTSWSQIN